VTLTTPPHLHVLIVAGGRVVSLASQKPWSCAAPNCAWTGRLPIPVGERLPAVHAVIRLAGNERTAAARVELLARVPSGRAHLVCGLTPPKFRRFGSPIVAAVRAPGSCGFWLVSANGGVFSFANAKFYGSVPGVMAKLHKRFTGSIAAAAAAPNGKGYWLVSANGGVFSFGDARYYGSLRGLLQREHRRLNQPIVTLKPMPGGYGYWLIAKDGGVFAFRGQR